MLLNFPGTPSLILWVRDGHPFTIESLQAKYPKLWDDIRKRKIQRIPLASLVHYKAGKKTLCYTASEFERRQELDYEVSALLYAKACITK